MPATLARTVATGTHPVAVGRIARSTILPLHVATTGLVALIALAAIALRLNEPASNQDAIAIASGLAVFGLIGYVRYGLRLPWLSASIVYLSLFWIFHYGLVFTSALSPDVLTRFNSWDLRWLYRPAVRMAMIVTVVGAAGFAFGVGLLMLLSNDTREQANANRPPDPALHLLGWIVLGVGLFGTAITLYRNGGVQIFGMGYLDFRTRVLGGTTLQIWVDASELGCLLAITGASRQWWILPLVVWSPIAVAMMLVGLRTEAMIPLVTYALVLTYSGVRLNRAVLVAALLAAVVLIPFVRMMRLVGFEHRAMISWSDVSPLDTFTELGVTLRAAEAYIDFIDEGDSYLLGASYWAPLDRQLFARIVPGREQVPFSEDPRIPSRELVFREGAVGESATGEAYYNFGPIGPFLYYGLVGALFGWFERRADATPFHTAALGIVVSIFAFNIRSHWVSVPAALSIALTFVFLGKVLSRLTVSASLDLSGAEPRSRLGKG